MFRRVKGPARCLLKFGKAVLIVGNGTIIIYFVVIKTYLIIDEDGEINFIHFIPGNRRFVR